MTGYGDNLISRFFDEARALRFNDASFPAWTFVWKFSLRATSTVEYGLGSGNITDGFPETSTENGAGFIRDCVARGSSGAAALLGASP
jgi:hypothetical protein